jgi:hypothetical protein
MHYVLRVVNIAALPQLDNDVAGMFIESIDLDGDEGPATLTARRSRALKFSTPADAYRAWSKQSTAHPVLPNGRQNRPLTQYSILIEAMPALEVVQ